MPFQLHFVLPENGVPDDLSPAERPAYTGLRATPDGGPDIPPLPDCTGCLLCVDDAEPFPAAQARTFAAALAEACTVRHAAGIFADFERPPAPAASEFLHTLAAILQRAGQVLIIPAAYRDVSPASAALLYRYDPADGPYATFLRRCAATGRSFYLEAAPICRLVRLPAREPGVQLTPETMARFLQHRPGPVWYAPAAGCNCLLRRRGAQLTLGLYDTEATLRRRLTAAAQAGADGALALYPEWQLYKKGSLPDGKEPLSSKQG